MKLSERTRRFKARDGFDWDVQYSGCGDFNIDPGVNAMTDKPLVLIAKRVWYYSENDEAAFFEWLDKLPCIDRYVGESDLLSIHVNPARIDAGSVYELISLFRRYGVDMQQLRAFDRDEFAEWFRNPQSHWYEEIFGERG